MEDNPLLSAEEINNAVEKKIEGYEGLSFLEQYAMFMGKTQILEFGLKGLLARKYAVPFESMEKWTLGRVKNELSKKGLRPDFGDFFRALYELEHIIILYDWSEKHNAWD